MGRIIGAGLLGGLLIFLWGFVSHMFLPLGMAGMVEVDDAKQTAVIEAMGANFQEPGIYMLPFMPEADWQDEAKSKAFGERAVTRPQAWVVYHPTGEDINANFMKMLGTQFGSDVLGALLAAIVASFLVGSYLQRVILITMMLGWREAVEPGDAPARVIVNSRTGTVVVDRVAVSSLLERTNATATSTMPTSTKPTPITTR